MFKDFRRKKKSYLDAGFGPFWKEASLLPFHHQRAYRLAMLNICLYQPEIPPNTGNIIRLCANTGSQLHLIKPLGFSLDEKSVRRSGLDYHDLAPVIEFDSWEHYRDQQKNRIFALSTKGNQHYDAIDFQPDDVLLFGPETRGLPEAIRHDQAITEVIRIPMCPNNRSLNLSNSVAIVLYEAWRQLGFHGAMI